MAVKPKENIPRHVGIRAVFFLFSLSTEPAEFSWPSPATVGLNVTGLTMDETSLFFFFYIPLYNPLLLLLLLRIYSISFFFSFYIYSPFNERLALTEPAPCRDPFT